MVIRRDLNIQTEILQLNRCVLFYLIFVTYIEQWDMIVPKSTLEEQQQSECSETFLYFVQRKENPLTKVNLVHADRFYTDIPVSLEKRYRFCYHQLSGHCFTEIGEKFFNIKSIERLLCDGNRFIFSVLIFIKLMNYTESF